MRLVRSGSSVVLAIPTGQGKTVPLFAASLGTGKTGMLILPLLNLEGQMEIDLTNLGISFVNMTTSSADELRRALESTPPPEIILTNVEGVGDKAKRDVLPSATLDDEAISSIATSLGTSRLELS